MKRGKRIGTKDKCNHKERVLNDENCEKIRPSLLKKNKDKKEAKNRRNEKRKRT